MSFVFTSQRTLDEIKTVQRNACYITSGNDGTPITLRASGTNYDEAYETLLKISEKLFKDIRKSGNLKGLKLGLCDCHSTCDEKIRLEGKVFCTDESTEYLRGLCNQSNSRSYSQ